MRRDTQVARAREPIFLSESSQLFQPLPHIVSSRKEKERAGKLQLAMAKVIDEGKTRAKENGQDQSRPEEGGWPSCDVVRASHHEQLCQGPCAYCIFTVHETIRPAEAFRATSAASADEGQGMGGGDGTIMAPRWERSCVAHMYVLPDARLMAGEQDGGRRIERGQAARVASGNEKRRSTDEMDDFESREIYSMVFVIAANPESRRRR